MTGNTRLFILISIVIFLIIISLYYTVDKKRFISKSLLAMELYSLIVSMIFGVCLAGCLSDGLYINNSLAWWIIGDDDWSFGLFRIYFEYSLLVSIFLLIIFIISTVIESLITNKKD